MLGGMFIRSVGSPMYDLIGQSVAAGSTVSFLNFSVAC